MITKLICWLWGYKVMIKAYTGNIEKHSGAAYYKWERQKYFLRCSKENKCLN